MVPHSIRSRRVALKAATALVSVMALTLSLAARADAVPPPVRPTPPPAVSPGEAVPGVRPVTPRFKTPPKPQNYVAPKPVWPAAKTETVAVAAPAGTVTRGAKTRAASLPIWTQASRPTAAPYAGPPAVDVTVLDRAATAKTGIAGVIFTVTATSPEAASVSVGLDYARFAQAYGGNYGSRLRLVQLPACVLSTPQVGACRVPTTLASVNDIATQTVSAPLSFTSAKTTGEQTLVVAASSDPGAEGGAGGNYAATELSPSGTWAAGGSTGAFTYSYPLSTPSARSSLVPKVALSYSSDAVDGKTVSTAAQSSWIGDGWSTLESYIEQSFVSCADDPEGSASPQKTNDQCYNGPVLTLSLDGQSTSLVWDSGKAVWKPKDDDGTVIGHVLNSGNGTGTHDEDYWTVTERDGTVYSFGRNHLPGWSAGKDATNSVDSVPVYSAHSTGPCYDATWSSSWCTMAYRWRLDYVKDVHGNAMSYYYKQDTNYYGRNLGATNTPYVRDSYLDHIDYGFVDGGAYDTVPDRISFAAGVRCVASTCTPLDSTTKANWYDTPYDLICASGGTCPTGPSFFSTQRLTAITTQQYSTSSGQYIPVDSYALAQSFPPSGDATSPTLWLDSIIHTGHDLTAGGSTVAIAMPPVTFSWVRLPNRVDFTTTGLPAFNRKRISTITTETGSTIQAIYGLTNPCASPVTLTPAANTSSCYPVKWTPPDLTAPITDWFNKYAVTQVIQDDPTGGAPAVATSYDYVGGLAWRFDESELVKAKYRTYGQFRGYAKVQTRTGDGGDTTNRKTLSETVYYRGMSKNNTTTVVSLTDSQNGVHEDIDQLAGMPLETTSYRGDGGEAVGSTIASYWVSAATATRDRGGVGLPDLTARRVAPVLSYSRQAVTTGGMLTWRVTATDYAYDDDAASATFGLLQRAYTHTVPVDASYDRCATNTYAAANTATNLVGLVAESETVSKACGGYTAGSPASVPGGVNTLTAAASVSRPAQVVSETRAFYDDPFFATTFPQTTAPSRGEVTMLRRAVDYLGGAYTFQTTGRTAYDSYGRVTDSYDGNANVTHAAYTDNSVGLTTRVDATNALNQTSYATLDTLRGLTLTATDPNTVVTTHQYDALGRTTSVWLNSRTTSTPANYTYAYKISNSGPTAVTTNRLNESLGYVTFTVIYDGLLRVRQAQSPTPQGGRLIGDAFYDSRGWVAKTYNGWWNASATPNTTLVTPTQGVDRVFNQDFYTYDGLGRVVYDQKAKENAVISTTTAVYNGDRATVIPPTGGVTSTAITDPLGRTTRRDDYKTTPTVTTPADTFTGRFYLSGGAVTSATYGYDGHGQQNTIGQAGSSWSTTYNLLGQATSKSDPDAGATSNIKYDADGNLVESTNARGKTISYTYDKLNRRTGQYASAVTAQVAYDQTGANQLAKWVYDNSDGAITLTPSYPIGHLTSETSYRYSGGTVYAYTVAQKNINVFGASTGTIVTIPAAEGTALGKSWTVSHTYTANTGLLERDIYTATGPLPSETVTHGYSGSLDLPTSLGGLAAYASGVSYNAYGRLTQQTMGTSPNQASVTNTYDDHTGWLKDQLVTRTVATPNAVDEQAYTYDLAGNVTKQVSTRLGSTATSETQCFGYDPLDRLKEAWTATDGCAVAPTTAAHAMVGDNLAAASAYWTSWGLDDQGNRTSQVRHAIPSGTDITTGYTYNGAGTGQPHTLTGTTTSGGATGTTGYGYNATGAMTSRTTALGTQTLTWDDADRLTRNVTVSGATTNTTDYVYDADGNLLLQKDPGTTILYLPGQQVALNTGAGTTTFTRYYPLPGGGSAVRTGTGTNYSFTIADPHGTADLRLDYTAQTPTWRQFTPYGGPRGATTTWIDNRGFLNQPVNTYTGLTQLGARDYDPDTGRFISVDPIFDRSNLQQFNGYSYAAANPITYSDPTGTWFDVGSGGNKLALGAGPAGQARANLISGAAEAEGGFVTRRAQTGKSVTKTVVKPRPQWVQQTPGQYTYASRGVTPGAPGAPACLVCAAGASASASAQTASVTRNPGRTSLNTPPEERIPDETDQSTPPPGGCEPNCPQPHHIKNTQIVEEKAEAQSQAASGGAGGGSKPPCGGNGGGSLWSPIDYDGQRIYQRDDLVVSIHGWGLTCGWG